MDYPSRVFYRTGTRGRLKASDARIVKENNNKTVFHIKNDDVKAIKSSGDETTVLGSDGEIEGSKLEYVWDKIHEHELYIHGGNYYATGCQVYHYGDHNGKIESEGGVDLRVNDTELSGSGDFNNNWDWSILENGKSSLVKIGQAELSDFFGKCCVYIGYDNEIGTLETFQSVI